MDLIMTTWNVMRERTVKSSPVSMRKNVVTN